MPSQNGVATLPGKMLAIRMPCVRTSFATHWIMPYAAHLDAT